MKIVGLLYALLALFSEATQQQSIGVLNEPSSVVVLTGGPATSAHVISSTGTERNNGVMLLLVLPGTNAMAMLVIEDNLGAAKYKVDYDSAAKTLKFTQNPSTVHITLLAESGDQVVIYFGNSYFLTVMGLFNKRTADSQYNQITTSLPPTTWYKTAKLSPEFWGATQKAAVQHIEWMDHLDQARLELLLAYQTKLLHSIFYDQQQQLLNRTQPVVYNFYSPIAPNGILNPAENPLDPAGPSPDNQMNFTQDHMIINSPNFMTHSVTPAIAASYGTFSVLFKVMPVEDLNGFFLVQKTGDSIPAFLNISFTSSLNLKIGVWDYGANNYVFYTVVGTLSSVKVIQVGILVVSQSSLVGLGGIKSAVYLMLNFNYKTKILVPKLPDLDQNIVFKFTMEESPSSKSPLSIYSFKIMQGGVFWSTGSNSATSLFGAPNSEEPAEVARSYKCVPSLHLDPAGSCTSCVAGQYNNTEIGHCSKCNSDCVICNNDFTCINCQPGTFMTLRTCQKCSWECLTCQDETGLCTSCKPSLVLIEGSCIDPTILGNYIEVNGTSVKCNPECLTCNTAKHICTSCDPFNYLPYYTGSYLTCVHRNKDLAKVKDQYNLLGPFISKFFPALTPLHYDLDGYYKNLIHSHYSSRILRGWVRIVPDKANNSLHPGNHTIMRLTNWSPSSIGDHSSDLNHNIILLIYTYSLSNPSKVSFYVQWGTGSISVGTQVFTLTLIATVPVEHVKNRWIYFGVGSDWVKGDYHACMVYEAYDPANPTFSSNKDIKVAKYTSLSSSNYLGSQLNNQDYMNTRFYIRFGGYGRLGLFPSELDDDNPIDFKSWVIENSEIKDSTYYINKAMGKEESRLYFNFEPIEKQMVNWANETAGNFTSVMMDNSPNFHNVYMKNVKTLAKLLCIKGCLENRYSTYYVKYNFDDLTKSLYVYSNINMTVGTPYLLSFFYSLPKVNPFPPISSLLIRIVSFSCVGCPGGLPKVETFVQTTDGLSVFYATITLPGGVTFTTSPSAYVADRIFSISYERMLHSNLVTYKLMWNYVTFASFTAKISLNGHTSSIEPGDVNVLYKVEIGSPTFGSKQFYGHIRNFTIFRDTTIQKDCEPGCGACTKSQDCLILGTSSKSLYGFKIHNYCPFYTSKYTTNFQFNTAFCHNMARYTVLSNSIAIQTLVRHTYLSPWRRLTNSSIININPNRTGIPWVDVWEFPTQSAEQSDYFYAPGEANSTYAGPISSLLFTFSTSPKKLPFTFTVPFIYTSNGVPKYSSISIDLGSRNISANPTVKWPPSSTYINRGNYSYTNVSFDLLNSDNTYEQYIMYQIERTYSGGVTSHSCPDFFIDKSNLTITKDCQPNFKLKCHQFCLDGCYGESNEPNNCYDCDPSVSEKIWTTLERTEFVCMEKGSVNPLDLDTVLPNVLECSVYNISNVPISPTTKYDSTAYPYKCVSSPSMSSFNLTMNYNFTYKTIPVLYSQKGDYLCPFSCSILKSMSKYYSICLNISYVKILGDTSYRCCRYGTDEYNCFTTCYDQPGMYPFNNTVCKSCPDPTIPKINIVDSLGNPLDAICLSNSSLCRSVDLNNRICYDCPPGYVGRSVGTVDFTCTPCTFKFFDPTALREVCISSCNKYPYYFYDTALKECVKCSEGTFYYPITGACEAICPTGNHVLDNTYCSNCSDPFMKRHDSCAANCKPGEFQLSTSGAKICVVSCPIHLYSNTTIMKCQPCDTSGAGTILMDGVCTTSSCPDGRFINQENECLPCHPSCKTCSSKATLCQTCFAGSGKSIFNTSSLCYSCGLECIGCHENYYRNCKSCTPPFADYTDETTGIKYCKMNLCQPGTILHSSTGLNSCAPCAFKYPGCAYCNAVSCTACLNGYSPWYESESKGLFTSCKPCKNTTSNSHSNFTTDALTGKCLDICGDGVRHTPESAPGLLNYLECDDGNLIDGDGCSSNCTVELNYVCSGGSFKSKDVCKHTNILEAKLTSFDNTTTVVTIEFSDIIIYNKSVDQILEFTFQNLTKGLDYDYSLSW